MKVSVFGLGIIGSIWSRHYAADGLLAAAWNRTPKPDNPGWESDIVAAARTGDVLQIVVADPPAVEGVLAAIQSELGPDKIVVQSSTIDPASSDRFRKMTEARGARYVEAPFTGSKPAAELRKTIFFLGGEAGVVADVEPVLARVSDKRFRIGTNAQAAVLKLSMNLQIAGVLEALCEGLTFARRAGISDDAFFEVLECNVANSGLTKLKGPEAPHCGLCPSVFGEASVQGSAARRRDGRRRRAAGDHACARPAARSRAPRLGRRGHLGVAEIALNRRRQRTGRLPPRYPGGGRPVLG